MIKSISVLEWEAGKKMKRKNIFMALLLCLFGFGQAYGQVNLKALTLPDG